MEHERNETENKIYLTIQEVSSRLNIKIKTIYALAASGDIPHYRIGRLIRFKQDEIDVWMSARKVVKINPDKTLRKFKTSIWKMDRQKLQFICIVLH